MLSRLSSHEEPAVPFLQQRPHALQQAFEPCFVRTTHETTSISGEPEKGWSTHHIPEQISYKGHETTITATHLRCPWRCHNCDSSSWAAPQLRAMLTGDFLPGLPSLDISVDSGAPCGPDPIFRCISYSQQAEPHLSSVRRSQYPT